MDFLDNLFQKLTRGIQFRLRRRPRASLHASVHQSGTRSEITLGSERFFIDIDDPATPLPATFDFVVPALAAISATRNIEIGFDEPVSQSLAARMDSLGLAYEVYCLSSISPPRLVLRNIVPDPPRAATGQRILCMSGGVDSTAAAIEASTAQGFTHGLLIAGADYPAIDHPGFVDLRGRVTRIADRLGMKLAVLKTDLRGMGIEWELTHGMLLASALMRMAGGFEKGAVGLDSGLAADFIMHPWGSSGALFALLSTPSFPITGFNTDTWRTQRVRRIVEHDTSLLNDLSVCWRDTSTGGNCGICFKCLRTRVALDALGHDGAHLFRETPPLMTFADMITMPGTFRALRTSIITCSETHHFMREGPEKAALGRKLARMHRAYARRMPYR